MFNILKAERRHAKIHLDIQEFIIIPQKKTFAENLVSCNRIFKNLKEIIEKNYGKEHLEFGDEGGFAPPISKTEQALYFVKKCNSETRRVKFALDCAASQFYKDGKYDLEGREMTKARTVRIL